MLHWRFCHRPRMRDSTLFKHLTSSSIVAACCVLGLLYFGREVLEPLALAVILSLVIAPLIRTLRRTGLGQVPATMLSVLMVSTCVVGLGIVLAFQLVAVTGDLPKYRAAIRTKVAAVRELTERPFARIDPSFAQCNGQLGGLPLLERHLDIGKCGAEAAEGRGDQGIERRRFGEADPHLPR